MMIGGNQSDHKIEPKRLEESLVKANTWGLPGCPVVNTLPSSAGDVGFPSLAGG